MKTYATCAKIESVGTWMDRKWTWSYLWIGLERYPLGFRHDGISYIERNPQTQADKVTLSFYGILEVDAGRGGHTCDHVIE